MVISSLFRDPAALPAGFIIDFFLNAGKEVDMRLRVNHHGKIHLQPLLAIHGLDAVIPHIGWNTVHASSISASNRDTFLFICPFSLC